MTGGGESKSICYCSSLVQFLLLIGLRPNQSTSLGAGSLFNVLARCETFPQIAKEAGLLLDVAFTKQRGNGPSGFLSVVEGDTTVEG